MVVFSDATLVRATIEVEWRRLRRFPELVPPTAAQQLLVSGEDHRHSRHPGFDPIAIGRAVWRRVSRRSREGASTIEQQIVRVITGRYERTYRRKIKEIVLATLVAYWFPKSVLPAIYLSIGYYGWRMNGYTQACHRLGFSSCPLSLDQAARLVARLKYPEPKHSPRHRILQIERRATHLCHLHQRHLIDGTYRHLDEKTIRNRSAFLEQLPQS